MNKIIKVKDIPKNFACIYKINYPNGKIYIGRSYDLKRRMYEHNNFKKAKAPCDFAIRKYGKITEVEILEEIKTTENIFEREKYWINKMNSTDRTIGYNISQGGKDACVSGENSFVSVWTDAEVLDIRKRKFLKEKKRDVYKDFSDRKFNSFSNIWEGHNYPTIGKEFICDTDWEIYAGENNGRTTLTNEIVKDIREKYRDGYTQKEIEQIYSSIPKTTLNRIIQKQTWKHIIIENDYVFEKRKGKSKLNINKVKTIKKMWMNGNTKEEILSEFPEINRQILNDILSERKWKEVKIDNNINFNEKQL